ncbi:MAG: M48 family metalloprotease [Leptospiraceae bacterium]|nr:M48 family metalloprotease [Leptospiraceae bacterium]MCP5497250.1 M48 family metalloprotease [Leptospiraceae bacterium]
MGLALSFCASTNGVQDRARQEELREENKIGKALAARLIKKFGLLKDETSTEYLNLVGNNIGRISSRPELVYHFGILKTNEINAYSCPGGYILVSMGALKIMRNEAELAFLLAHEVSHVTLGHSIPPGGLKKQGGIIEFIANFLGGGGGLLNTAIEQASNEMEKMLLEKGREKQLEYDADISGVLYSVGALNYDLKSAVNYFKRINDAAGNEILSKTHPDMNSRIQKIEKFAKEQSLPTSGNKYETRFLAFQSTLLKALKEGK